MKVLVTGSRYYNDVSTVWRILDSTNSIVGGISLLIDGASDDVTGPYIGADYWSHQWACAHNIPTSRYHAQWKIQGKAAGPIRNKRMLDEAKPEILVAFPGNNGTRNMIELCQKAKINIRFVQ